MTERLTVDVDVDVDVDVLIVGAGASGLYTAQCLSGLWEKNAARWGCRLRPLRILVVEAEERIGGRIQTVFDLGDKPGQHVEMGAELIHGDASSLVAMANRFELPMTQVYTWAHGDGGPDPDHCVNGGKGYYYFGESGDWLASDSRDDDFVHLRDVLDALTDPDALRDLVRDYGIGTKGEDILPLSDVLKQCGVSQRMLALADASYANTVAARLDALPLRPLSQLERLWEPDGDGEFRFDRSMQDLVARLANGVEIWPRWVVQSIVMSSAAAQLPSTDTGTRGPVCVRSRGGETVFARVVVLTPSVAVLRDGDIKFDPPLPSEKMRALRCIQFEPCVKLAIRFSKRFWPGDMHGVVCANCLVPELWVSQRGTILMGFANADFARRLSTMSYGELRTGVLAQLDRMYGSAENPTPATNTYITLRVHDWGKSPHVRGGYSCVGPREPDIVANRRVFAQPAHGGRLFFAGEATVPNFCMINSAFDSGSRCAREIWSTLFPDDPLPAVSEIVPLMMKPITSNL